MAKIFINDKAVSIIELGYVRYHVGGNSPSSNLDRSMNHGGFDWWNVRLVNNGNII